MEQVVQLGAQRQLFSMRALFRLIVPLVIEQALSVAVGVADILMISVMGEAAVSGIALVNEINTLMIQLLAALATGGAVVVSQYLGRGEASQGRTAAGQLMMVVSALSLVLMTVSLLFNGGILRLIYGKIDESVMHSASVYFYFSAASYPFIGLYNASAALFRSMGNSKVSMMTALLMNIVHIGSNAICIYVLRLGVAGVAVSSLLSRILAAVVMQILLNSRHNAIYLDYKKFKYVPDMVKRILLIGVPNGLENGMFQIGKLMTQSIVASLGTVALAAHATAGNIMSVAIVPGSAIGLAMITVVGQCMGAGEQEQAAQNVRRMILMAYGANILLSIALYTFAKQTLGLYGLEEETIVLAQSLIPLFSLAMALIWPASFALANALRAAGDVRYTMVVSMFSMWVFRVALSSVFATVFHLGLNSVWYAMYIDWMVRSILIFTRWRSGKWRAKRVI